MKVEPFMLLACFVLAGLTATVWGWVISLVHFETGVFIGILMFWLGIKMLVNNVKRIRRTRYDY